MSAGSGPSSERDADAHEVFMRLADASLTTSYRLAAHLLGDPADAEDATQEALLLAWRGWPRLRDPDRFGPWFDRILVNVCFERLRRRRRAPTVELPAEFGVVADAAAATLARDSVGRALLGLTPEQRIVVAGLRHVISTGTGYLVFGQFDDPIGGPTTNLIWIADRSAP